MPSQKVTLEKTYQLDAAYVQMYGWDPPTPCLACVQEQGPFREFVFANNGTTTRLWVELVATAIMPMATAKTAAIFAGKRSSSSYPLSRVAGTQHLAGHLQSRNPA
jgi:hypothetical protein